MKDVHSTIEEVARGSYARLLACLMAQSRDWAASEDAIGEAFRSAMETWSRDGIPENPEGWLLVVARRRIHDRFREMRRHEDVDWDSLIDSSLPDAREGFDFQDERLQMLFLCAHPAIDKSLHTPLMLQAVLGLSADRIASTFLAKPATMGQRLSRAKAKIKQAKIRFEVPGRSEMPARLDAVLEATYTAYGAGWEAAEGSDPGLRGLAEEAILLGRQLAELMPEGPEVRGLLALMLYCESRKPARRDANGKYIPLSEQATDLWSKQMIAEAEEHLAAAARMGSMGRFQLEAAIQSAHMSRAVTGRTDWVAIEQLYAALIQIAPTVGAQIARAAAVSEAYGAEAGLKSLEPLSHSDIVSHQPYWALVAHLQGRLGNKEAARDAYQRAIGLCADPAVRQFLLEKAAQL